MTEREDQPEGKAGKRRSETEAASGEPASTESESETAAEQSNEPPQDSLSTPTPPRSPLADASTDSTPDASQHFSHLSKTAIPADFLDSACQSNSDLAPEAAYPSPASTLRPPPVTEGDTAALVEKLDERIARAKERPKPPKLDMTTPSLDSNPSAGSLPTPTSPAVPPRPTSRPSSRAHSTSRRQSTYSTRSPSSPMFSPPLHDSKRLSVASSTGLASPRLVDGMAGGNELFEHGHGMSRMPPSPLGPSRRNSSNNLKPSPRLDSSRRESSSTTGQLDTETPEEIDPWDVPVVVRDWAYPESDPRHLGLPHPDEEAGGRFRRGGSSRNSNRYYARHDGTDEDEEEDERRQGLGLGSPIDQSHQPNGSFSWGFVTSHSTDFPNSSPASSSTGGRDDYRGGPSGYSFHDADYDDDDEHDPHGRRHEYDQDDRLYYSNGQHEQEIEHELGLGEFVPGVYQAVYEFLPELETEMKLSVGEWVSVFERQCAGWVQAGRIVDGVLTDEVGLVPENYLHRLDFEDNLPTSSPSSKEESHRDEVEAT
ncbi:uncharacterized protein JCM15063_006049 [Sporobolomyces koalae]|uniref:uncharacterized protein n=1 Tax=Sporobolomyces koalae TaxID=500713 RepID=UPI003178C5F3